MPRRRTIGLTLLLLIVALLALVLIQGESLVRIAAGIGRVDPLLAALGVGVSALAITNRGLLSQASHRAVGIDAGLEAMTRTATVGFAAQKLVKSAGAAGLAVFVRHGRRRGHAPAAVVTACLLSAVASFVALGVVLVATIAVVVATGRATGWWTAAAIGFGTCGLGVVVAVAAMLRSRDLAERWWRRTRRIVARLRRRPAPDDESASPVAELFEAVELARRRPGALGCVLLFAVLSKVLGALSFAIAVAAVGLPASVDGALVVYGTALAAALVSIVPGGLGTVEGSTAALLVASGASAGAAALAVALFRILDLWLPLAAGAVAARGELRPGTSESGVASAALIGRADRVPIAPVPVAA